MSTGLSRLLSVQAADFVRQQLWDESTKRLRRSFCRNPSAVQGFADDYAFLISEPYSYCMTSHACTASFVLSVSLVVDFRLITESGF